MDNLTHATLVAAKDPTHPKFHFSLGQILGTVLLGLQAYAIEKTDPLALLVPQNAANLFSGILSIWEPLVATPPAVPAE